MPPHLSSAPTPEPSPPASPSLCFPTWQVASLTSGWRPLTRLQYKHSCRKWHQLRWRTKTLRLQSGSPSFCTEGVSHNPGEQQPPPQGKKSPPTTKKCQTSRRQSFLSSSGVLSTKPDQDSSSLIIGWTVTAARSTSSASCIPGMDGDLSVLCSPRLRGGAGPTQACARAHTHTIGWTWFAGGFWHLKIMDQVPVFLLSFFCCYSLSSLPILPNHWGVATQQWQIRTSSHHHVFEGKTLATVRKWAGGWWVHRERERMNI